MSRYCGIISSPELLERSYNIVGKDVTNTRNDFKVVLDWLRSKFRNTYFYGTIETAVEVDGHLSVGYFKSGIRFAFQAFDPIRNTGSPEAEEMVLLYYTGHGLSEEGASRLNRANLNGKSSSPRLEEVNYHQDNSAAQEFLTLNRVVKGGELCLHEVGYCDLEGLLQPWIASVTNSDVIKHNKHVVIIADSCYSGKLVDDLAKMNGRPGPWNENGCTVTVQSACSSGEKTLGGYFTPCFVYYNQHQDELQELIKEWNDKPEFIKDAYRGIDLPSPQLETTGSLPEDADNSPVLRLPFQDFELRLFRDPRFFKFCCLKYSGALGPPRALDGDTVDTLLGNPEGFNFLDYKLKTMAINGKPLALVLVKNPENGQVICVHIHFQNCNTGLDNVSGVNLVEHGQPRYPSRLFPVVNETGSRFEMTRRDAARYAALVRQCREYVDGHEPEWWGDIAKWKMRHSVNDMFRMKERSAWMDEYLEEVAPVNVIYLLKTILHGILNPAIKCFKKIKELIF